MKNFHIRTDIDFEINSPKVKNILIAVLLLVLLFFIVYPISVFQEQKSDIRTITAVKQTVYKTIDVEAFAVRQETDINNTFSGTIVPSVANGNKVAIGDSVAEIYSDSGAAENAQRIKELKEEIEYYRSIEATSGGLLQTDIDLHKGNVANSLFALSSAIEEDELSSVYSLSRQLREAVTKKQIALGNKVDVSGILNSLVNEYEALKNSSVPKSVITAQKSGYYVNTSDGYENTVDFSSVKDLCYDDVERILSSEPSAVSSDNVGKLITDFNWYLVCNTTLEALGDISAGSFVKVTFSNSPVDELTMQVERVNQKEPGDPVTLVLLCNIMDEDIASLRKASIKIKVESYTGLAVERSALRTVDGQKGVYVKVGNIAEFKKINIIYSDQNYVLTANPDKERGHLELYDEIILEGTELYDEKLLN